MNGSVHIMPLKNSGKSPSDDDPLIATPESTQSTDHFTKIRRVPLLSAPRCCCCHLVDISQQATNTNRLVGDNRDGRSVMSMVLPSPSAADHNLRFAPQWTAPEMLRTPLGV